VFGGQKSGLKRVARLDDEFLADPLRKARYHLNCTAGASTEMT